MDRKQRKVYLELDELNTKHHLNKFEYKTSKTTISFLDTDTYIKTTNLTPRYIENKPIARASFI